MNIIYDSSTLYNDLVSLYDNINEIQTNFGVQFKNFGFTKEQIFHFIKMYDYLLCVDRIKKIFSQTKYDSNANLLF